MAGLDPPIHAPGASGQSHCLDARVKRGHDEPE